jgi:hypothetical protein
METNRYPEAGSTQIARPVVRKAKPANVTTREEGLTYLDRKRASIPNFARSDKTTNCGSSVRTQSNFLFYANKNNSQTTRGRSYALPSRH